MAVRRAAGLRLGPKPALAAAVSWGVTENVRLNPQEMVGQFRVETELGHGAFGSVYRAYHTVLERAVAIKVVFPELAHAESAFKQLVREHDARSKVRDFGHILRASSPQRCEYQGLVAICVAHALSLAEPAELVERTTQPEGARGVQGVAGTNDEVFPASVRGGAGDPRGGIDASGH